MAYLLILPPIKNDDGGIIRILSNISLREREIE